MSVRLRAFAGYAVLLVLFLALVVLQLMVDSRLRAGHETRAAAIEGNLDTNRSFLQHMTDAETGVRGFQLTGRRVFLDPYQNSLTVAYNELDQITANSDDADVRRLVATERVAALQWFSGYASPILVAGVANDNAALTASGKTMFDQVRHANLAVDSALLADQVNEDAGAHRDAGIEQLVFVGLVGAILLIGFFLASMQRRELLVPVAKVRETVAKLAAGDRSARVQPSGAREMRELATTLNELAAETERLLADERSRSARGELRQMVAAELQSGGNLRAIAERVAARIGETLGADRVHARVTVRRGHPVRTAWPAGAPVLETSVLRQISSGEPYTVRHVVGLAGAIGMALSGDTDCPPGVLCLVRDGDQPWTDDERRLVLTVGREIDHAVRQERLRLRQERLINELRILDEQKDVFVSTVTHELRTPLTSILGYTEMLSDGEAGDLSPTQQRGLTVIQRNANRLQATVADLLLLDRTNERVGAGAATVDLGAVVTGLHSSLAGAARAKDLESTLEVEQAWVRGDAVNLERALRNLMENAIKFTPAGGSVTFRVSTDDDQAVVTVTDTGIGIPADDLPGLFTPFHRAANAMHLAVQGNGLGLAIVRTIVKEHGGEVDARSELDRGSEFTVRLPAIPR